VLEKLKCVIRSKFINL